MPSTLWCSSGQDLKKCDAYEQLDFIAFDPCTKYNEGKLKGRDSKIFRITKLSLTGSLEIGMCHDKEEIHDAVKAKVHELGTRGIRLLALARMDKEDGLCHMPWYSHLPRPPAPDTKQTIMDCHKYDVAVNIIPGDPGLIAQKAAHLTAKFGGKIFMKRPRANLGPTSLFSAPCAHVDAYHAPQ